MRAFCCSRACTSKETLAAPMVGDEQRRGRRAWRAEWAAGASNSGVYGLTKKRASASSILACIQRHPSTVILTMGSLPGVDSNGVHNGRRSTKGEQEGACLRENEATAALIRSK
jgi:hypothetical protein